MRKLILFLIILCSSFSISFAQMSGVQLPHGSELYSDIYLLTNKKINELDNIHQKGTLFVRFSIKLGKLQDLRFSEESPKLLISIIQDAFELYEYKLKSKTRTQVFVLPIMFDYAISPITKAADLLENVPEVDLEKFSNIQRRDNFESFSGLSKSKSKVEAIRVNLLPWIKLSGKKY